MSNNHFILSNFTQKGLKLDNFGVLCYVSKVLCSHIGMHSCLNMKLKHLASCILQVTIAPYMTKKNLYFGVFVSQGTTKNIFDNGLKEI